MNQVANQDLGSLCFPWSTGAWDNDALMSISPSS